MQESGATRISEGTVPEQSLPLLRVAAQRLTSEMEPKQRETPSTLLQNIAAEGAGTNSGISFLIFGQMPPSASPRS